MDRGPEDQGEQDRIMVDSSPAGFLKPTGSARGAPQGDFGRQIHRAESKLPGTAAYSHCRPGAAFVERLLSVR